MNRNRILVVLVVLITGIFVAATGSFAGKPGKCSPWPACKDDGGDPPPPPPPPAECNDPSPSFIYKKEGKRNSTGMLYIASKDNCIHTFIMPDLGPVSTHMTAPSSEDGSVNGVIISKEEPGNLNVRQLRRADFTVNAALELTYLDIDPDPIDLGDPGVPDGDFLDYNVDIWGNSNHSELYLVVKRSQGDSSGFGSSSITIYNLYDLSDKRELHQTQDNPNGYTSNWFSNPISSCPEGTIHPQFVAGCYRPFGGKWNPSATAIYMDDDMHASFTPEISADWTAVLRLPITRAEGVELSNWGISDPQIVFTGTQTEIAGFPTSDLNAMPGRDGEGYTDLIFEAVNFTTDSAQVGLLDVDYCVDLFKPISNPDPDILDDLWLDCLVTEDPFTGVPFNIGEANGGSWISPTEIVHGVREKGGVHLYKTNIHTGVSTKLVDKVAR